MGHHNNRFWIGENLDEISFLPDEVGDDDVPKAPRCDNSATTRESENSIRATDGPMARNDRCRSPRIDARSARAFA
jgi:hypothetical protein